MVQPGKEFNFYHIFIILFYSDITYLSSHETYSLFYDILGGLETLQGLLGEVCMFSPCLLPVLLGYQTLKIKVPLDGSRHLFKTT